MGREVDVFARGGADVAEELHDASGHLGRHGCAAGHDLAQALDEPPGRCLLQEIARGAGAERVEDPLVVVVDRERQDEEVGPALLQADQEAEPFSDLALVLDDCDTHGAS